MKKSTKIVTGAILGTMLMAVISFPALFKAMVGLKSTITENDFAISEMGVQNLSDIVEWLGEKRFSSLDEMREEFFQSELYTRWLMAQDISAGNFTMPYDTVMYLSAKYESSGNPDAAGSDGSGGYAFGEWQMDWKSSLLPFLNWAYQKDPEMYAGFEPYLNVTPEVFANNQAFYSVWHQIYAANGCQFECDQEQFAYNEYYTRTRIEVKRAFGIDLDHRSDALKAVAVSLSNRSGFEMRTLFGWAKTGRIWNDAGISNEMTDRELIDALYAAYRKEYPKEERFHLRDEQGRLLEHGDALALLDGTLDIYAKSENSAGGIDWSRRLMGSNSGNAVIEAAVSWAVGIANDDSHGYSMVNRHGPDYDCSSLILHAYAVAGLLLDRDGCTADMVPDLLENGFVDVTDLVNLDTGEGLKRGDIVWYPPGTRGKEVGHVEMMVTNNTVVGAHSNQDGKTGDSSGREIDVRDYRNKGYVKCLRFSVPSQTTSGTAADPNDPHWVSIGTFKITAYCDCRKCQGKYVGQSASGRTLMPNHSIAVNRQQFPGYENTFRIEGLPYVYYADDNGDKHIAKNCFDLFVGTHAQTEEWGVKYRQVWMYQP